MDKILVESILYFDFDFEAIAPMGEELIAPDFCVNCESCCPGSCTGCTQCNKCNLLF